MRNLVLLLALSLLTSCMSDRVRDAYKSLEIVKTELSNIQSKALEVQHKVPEASKSILTSVSKINNEIPKVETNIKEIDEESEPSVYQKYIPWALMFGGIAMLWFGIKTPDPWDDITGAIMCGSSFVVAKYFDEITMWASALLLLYLIIIGAKYFALRRTKRVL